MPFELKPYNLNIPTSNSELWSANYRYPKTQFNLGNTKYLEDPMKTANALLEREYSRVAKGELTESVFIPPVFMSKEYGRDIPTLEGDVDKTIDDNYNDLKKNYPEHWLTSQLRDFLDNGKKKCIEGWISKMKILYLINSSLQQSGKKIFLPSWQDVRRDLIKFSEKCIAHLNTDNPEHELIKEIRSNAINKKQMKAWLTKKVKSSFEDVEINPPMVALVLKYLFGLKYSQIVGEQAERFLFEHLEESKHLLSDFVIFHSLKIFTAASSSHSNQKEYDFLLLSAERRLIIAIEVKQNKSQSVKAKKQLEKSKQLFEEHLGDQLDGEWTFYPVVLKIKLQISSCHQTAKS